MKDLLKDPTEGSHTEHSMVVPKEKAVDKDNAQEFQKSFARGVPRLHKAQPWSLALHSK